MLTAVLDLAKSPLAEKYDISSMKTAASGAAALSVELRKLVREKHQIEITNGYGMTEMTPIIAMQTPLDLKRHNPDTVGMLVPNTEARIVDPESGEGASRHCTQRSQRREGLR